MFDLTATKGTGKKAGGSRGRGGERGRGGGGGEIGTADDEQPWEEGRKGRKLADGAPIFTSFPADWELAVAQAAIAPTAGTATGILQRLLA